MRHSIALLCLCPLAEPKTVTISNIVERRDVCVVALFRAACTGRLPAR
jgi:hypothetical protein